MNNNMQKNVTFDEIITILQNNIKETKSTFTIKNAFVECQLGGKFIPIWSEAQEISQTCFLDTGKAFQCALNSIQKFSHDDTLSYNNITLRLYYDILKKHTFIEEIYATVTGQGQFELIIIAENSGTQKIIQKNIVDFGSKINKINLPKFEIISLPENCSLYLMANCIGGEGIIYGFRWIGLVREQNADFGTRVVLIRTYRGMPTVRNGLKKICYRLLKDHPDILKRTIFLIYDATENPQYFPIAENIPFARILELKGNNYGGGGNASLLISLMRRINEETSKSIAEILVMDDDAKTDAETFVRQDGFITARKKNVISSAVVYQSNAPTVVQEYGGMWGKYFSPVTSRVKITEKDSERTLMPYLVRSTRDMSKDYNVKYIANNQDVEFATFIFISFPYEFLRKIGAPIPFFLRNDDVEICLRAIKNGGKLVINPNLQVWHDTAHNPASEFYAILHGLIVNNAYGGINKEYFYTTFLERISKIAKSGNCALLEAYSQSLEKFADGPDWMNTDSIYKTYSESRDRILMQISEYAQNIPFEVVEINKDKIHIININDQLPDIKQFEDIIFIDTKNNKYFSYDKVKCSNLIKKQLEMCINNMNKIINNFDIISDRWKKYIYEFDDKQFWNEILKFDKLYLYSQNININNNEFKNTDEDPMVLMDVNKKVMIATSEFPKGFTDAGYLAHNPDVMASGMDPKAHWLKFGRYEGRKF